VTVGRPVVDFAHLGPMRHGVRRYGELLDRAVTRSGFSGPSAPGAMSLYDPAVGPAERARAIDRAIDRPDATWGTGPPDQLRAPAVVAAHLDLYRSLL
jgi:hypothetical protein